MADASAEASDLEARMHSVESAMPELGTLKARIELDLSAAEAALEAARGEILDLEAARGEATEREIEARSAHERLAARIAAAREKFSDGEPASPAPNGVATGAVPTGSLTTGAGAKLRTVLESLNGDRPAIDPSFLLDVINAPAELRPAVSAVLGNQAEAVIVESPEFAIRAIEVLKQKQGGRLSFIPEPEFPVSHHEIEAPGIAGRLVEMVTSRPGFESVVEATLGHVLVAEDLPSALAASNLNGHGAVFVTRDGDVLWPGRMLSGGSAAENSNRNGALPHEHAEQNLDTDLETMEADEHALAEQLAACRASRERIVTDLAAAARARRRPRTRLAPSAPHWRKSSRRFRLRGRIATTPRAGSPISGRRSCRPTRGSPSWRRTSITRAAGSRNSARKPLIGATARSRPEPRMLEVASRFEARKAQLDALEAELRHMVELTGGLEAQLEANRRDLERSQAERAEFERELHKFAGQDEDARARDAELSAELDSMTEALANQERDLEALQAGLKQAREVAASLEGEAVECALRRERALTLSEELSRAFAEKFRVEFDAVAPELASQLDGREAVHDENRLVELRAKAERIGEVNLAAESEVKELEERAGVLNTERADLQTAVHDLTSTITKLQSRGPQALRRNL